MQRNEQRTMSDAIAETVQQNVRAGESYLTKGRQFGLRGADLRAFVAAQLRRDDEALSAFIRCNAPGLALVEADAAPEIARARELALLELFPPADRN